MIENVRSNHLLPHFKINPSQKEMCTHEKKYNHLDQIESKQSITLLINKFKLIESSAALQQTYTPLNEIKKTLSDYENKIVANTPFKTTEFHELKLNTEKFRTQLNQLPKTYTTNQLLASLNMIENSICILEQKEIIHCKTKQEMETALIFLLDKYPISDDLDAYIEILIENQKKTSKVKVYPPTFSDMEISHLKYYLQESTKLLNCLIQFSYPRSGEKQTLKNLKQINILIEKIINKEELD